MKRIRSQRKIQAVQENEQHLKGLPPRRKRHSSRPKRKITKYFQMGLLVFGTIAIGLIVFELIQASTKSNIAVTYTEPVATSLPAETNSTSTKPNTEPPSVKPDSSISPEQPATSSATNEQPVTSSSTPEQPTAGAVQQEKPATSTVAPEKSATNSVAPEKPATKPVSETQKPSEPVKVEKPKAIKHRVTSGDTLFKLSRKYYGNGMGVDKIASYNGLNKDNPLPVGKTIYIPVR